MMKLIDLVVTIKNLHLQTVKELKFKWNLSSFGLAGICSREYVLLEKVVTSMDGKKYVKLPCNHFGQNDAKLSNTQSCIA